MTLFHDIPASSISSIKATIQSDYTTYRWFVLLISRKEVKSRLSVEEGTKKAYQQLNKRSVQMNSVVCVWAAALLVTTSSTSYWVLGSAVPLAFISAGIYNQKKILVSDIAERLLTGNSTVQELSSKTLYQIGEYFADRYQIPSLSDFIYHSDHNSRFGLIIVMLVALTLLLTVSAISPAGILLASAGAYGAISLLIHSTVICKFYR